MRRRLIQIAGLVCLTWGILPCTRALRAQTATQTLELAPGWNLVSIQVVGPDSGGEWSIGQLTNRFRTNGAAAPAPSNLQFWAYEAQTGGFTGRIPEQPDFPDNERLTRLQPGRGYWIQVGAKATLALDGPVTSTPVELPAGAWTLFGLPGVAAGADLDFELSSVFGTRLADIEELWTWSPELKRYVGYKPGARPALLELTHIRPGQGYWIRARAAIRLDAAIETLLPPDVDQPPLADRSGTNATAEIPHGPLKEDAPFDLDADGKLDSAQTQRTLLFAPGVRSQGFSVRRSSGPEVGGLSQWEVSSPQPWIALSPTNGVVGSETDTITVTVNRAGLAVGTYLGRIELRTPSETRLLDVRMVVPTAEGDYRGAATITRVNGKDISLGKVDLHLSLFNDPPPAGEVLGRYFHAVINRDEALLFPQDALLRGVFYDGLNFSLTTTFTMPAGDRNMPPYETFKTPKSTVENEGRAFGDIDENGNGRLDNLNPFPFPVRRQVTLLGRRVDDDVLEGTYVEALPDVIQGTSVYMEGTFRLERLRLEPSRRTAFIGRSQGDPLSIGGSLGSEQVSSIEVSNPISLSEAIVRINVNHPATSNLVYRLVSPQTNSFALVESNGVWVARGLSGNEGAGSWKLVVSWDPSVTERGRLVDWELNLIGFNYRTVTATIQRDLGTGPQPFAGARLTLIGGNVPSGTNASSPTHVFTELTEDSYVLRAEYPGYRPAQLAFTLANTNMVLPPLVLRPFDNPTPELVAEPFVGSAPLFSRQVLRMSPAYVTTNFGTLVEAIWTMGNGTRLTNSGAAAMQAVENTYTNGGHYTNTVRLRGSNGRMVTLSNWVHAHALAPNLATLPLQDHPLFLQPVAFIGSGSALPVVASARVTNRILLPEGNTLFKVSNAGANQPDQGRDVAAFDFQIPDPGNLTNPWIRNLEFFYQADPAKPETWTRMRTNSAPLKPSPSMLAEYPGVRRDPWVAYTSQPAMRYRMEVTLGGTVFGPFEYPGRPWADESARVGGLILQTGRIEP